MRLPDGFVIRDVYLDRDLARDDLNDYRDFMEGMYCPFRNGPCVHQCMFYSDGDITTHGDGHHEITLPKCTIFLGGQE